MQRKSSRSRLTLLMAVSAAMATELDELANILSELSEKPFDFPLHRKHINVAQKLQTDVLSAMEMMTNFFPATDEVWIPILDAKRAELDINTANGVGELLALYEKAENDYLSIPILKSHFDFVLDQYTKYAEGQPRPEELGDVFNVSWTRSVLEGIANKATGHLTQSKVLWDPYRDWELSNLQTATGAERQELVVHVEQLLLNRLGQPHSNSDETAQAYSSFTTNYKPTDQYESLMVAASKTRSKLAKAYDRRDPMETAIVQSNNSLDSFARYALYERRSKYPDILVMSIVYERAISEAAKRRFNGESGAEEALRSFWTGYCDALRITGAGEELEVQVLKRAIRSVPGSGEVWARYIRHLERFLEPDNPGEYQRQITEIYTEAFSRNVLQSDVEQIIPVVLARAGFERRRIESGDADSDTFANLVAVVENGLDMVRKASPQGDTRLRLEKFLVDIYSSAELHENAIQVLQAATRYYKTSCLAWTLYTETLLKFGDINKARATFKDAAFKNLDWPEAILEAWLTFEHLHGSVKDVDACLDTIGQAQHKINTRRAKEAERASRYSLQMAVDQQPPQDQQDQLMDVDQPLLTDRGVKRSADDAQTHESYKKARVDPPALPLKRDRENCTVFVADLPHGTDEQELTQLFKDCGNVREVKITSLSPETLVATVEFSERDSVLPALTKDKKRLKGQEISVHLAWKSTLYITNFPENVDDEFIRNLFGKYGTVFDVRWPSKKFKSTRRFCYVQYTSPASAQEALVLHGFELEPGLSLNVYLSDPERKKDRTDRDANDRELYVAGLARHTTQADLENLFKTYGTVKEVRMALDKDGTSKGFAFVEFEDERQASAALQANNYELRKRRIAVTISDSRARGKSSGVNTETGLGQQADMRLRSVRIKNLPPATQEGLLQQVLEKIAVVKRLEVFSDKNEALVELENAAEAGKLLLRTEPVLFGGQSLQFSEEAKGNNSQASTSGMFIPRAANRPRAGVGNKKRNLVISSETAAHANKPQSASTTAKGGKGQDDFRKLLGSG